MVDIINRINMEISVQMGNLNINTNAEERKKPRSKEFKRERSHSSITYEESLKQGCPKKMVLR